MSTTQESIDEAVKKFTDENTYLEERRKRREEQARPHADRAKELSAKFLRDIEAEGYEGFAIVGIPNRVIDPQFDPHVEQCGHCAKKVEGDFVFYSDLCEQSHDALFEDNCFELFVYQTPGAGSTSDFFGFTFDLSGDDTPYPHTRDLLGAAEPYRGTGFKSDS